MIQNRESLDELLHGLASRRADQGFFQAVRMVLRATGTTLGEDLSPREEAVRLRAEASEAFPASEIARVSPGDEADPRPVFDVSFFGLYGPSGALPLHYTQLIIDRLRKKDTALRDFLDLFNHRLLSIFYRAYEKHHLPVAFETANRAGNSDLISECLMALAGFGNPGVRGRQEVPDVAWLHFAGLQSLRGPRPDALANIVAHHFGVPAEVHSFRGEWLRIPRAEQTSLGSPRLGREGHNALGVTAVAGARVWAVEHRFRLTLGPLGAAQFARHAPGGSMFVQLGQLVRTYAGPQFDFDVQLVLRREDVPGTTAGSASGSRLGHNTWLGEWRSSDHARDAAFECEGRPGRG